MGVLAFLALGEVVGRLGLTDRDSLPPTSAVLRQLGIVATDSSFWSDVWVTTRSWLLGLGIAALIALLVGVVLGSIPLVNAAVRVVVEFLRPIPSVASVSVAIILFGLGTQMRLFVVVYAAIWPTLFNTIYGLMEVDPLAKETARSFGFGRLAVLRRVALPSAAPFAFTGLRLSAGTALIVEISVELIAGSDGGIGAFIVTESSASGHTDAILAATLVTGALGFLANEGLEAVGRKLFRWTEVGAG